MLKHRFSPLVAALVMVSMLCQGTWVLAGTTGNLTGTVVDSTTSAPIGGAKVTAASPSQIVSGVTDATGHFTFLSVAPDTYVVSVQKAGYDDLVQSGVTVQADNTATLALRAPPSLRTIATVRTRSPESLIKPGTTTDVYSIGAATQAAVAAAGGGGNLNSAWSAISTVPGVYVAPGQNGYIGAGATLSIRGGDYDQIGYEIDGVPVNRAFDNYPSGPASSLGQQELQVYTGVPPANAEANGLSGFINQVIRTGSYPGFALADLSIGGPAFYHKASFEFGGASPNRNFSYYVGLGGYNQDFRYYDQYNGAPFSGQYGVALAPCADVGQKQAPSCYTPQGVYYGTNSAYPGFFLGPANLNQVATVADRDNVVNLHFGLPHKNGTKDDIQLLGMVNYIQNPGYYSTNDQGGPNYVGPNSPLAAFNFGTAPVWYDGYQYNGTPGTFLPSNYQSLTKLYYFPNFSQNRPISLPGLGQFVAIPNAQRDAFENDQAIYKVQYTHAMGTDSLFKVYAYTYYSDWMNSGPQSTYASYIGIPADYELSSHTRGVSGTFTSQLGAENLLNVTGSWTTATTTRDNNTQMINGAYGPNSVNNRTVLAAVVDSSDPTNGLCYTSAGVATTCSFIKGPQRAQFATLAQAFLGTIAPATGTCGGGACEYLTLENGLHATYNQVQPTFTSASITDQWRPNAKTTVDIGIRLDDFSYQGSDTTGTAARAFWYTAFNLDTCVDKGNNLFDKVAQLGLASPLMPCPAG